jgi:hypothetical protein
MNEVRRISRYSCQGFCSISRVGPQGLFFWSSSLKGGAGNTCMPLHDHPYNDVNIIYSVVQTGERTTDRGTNSVPNIIRLDGKRGAFIERCGSQADLPFTWCLQVSVLLLTVRWFLEDFPLSFIFNTAGFVHSACTLASVISGATRLDSMYSCLGRYSPLQSLFMFGAEFVPRSVVLSPICTTL